MAASNRLASFAATMAWEGGDRLSLDRNDPGNWTEGQVGRGSLKGSRYGVSAAAHPDLDPRTITLEEASRIFVAEYWNAVGADDLPLGLDHCVSDCAYNSGASRAKALLSAVHGGDVTRQIDAFTTARLASLKRFASWSAYGNGWARRCAGVEAESLRMAGLDADALHVAAKAHASKGGTAYATGAGGAVVVAAPLAASGQIYHFGAMLVATLALLGVCLALRRSSPSRIRAQALAAASANLRAATAQNGNRLESGPR